MRAHYYKILQCDDSVLTLAALTSSKIRLSLAAMAYSHAPELGCLGCKACRSKEGKQKWKARNRELQQKDS